MAFLGAAAVFAGALGAATALGIGVLGEKVLPPLPPECPAAAVVAAPLSGLAVNVYNSAGVEGLGAATAKALKTHGVDVVSMENKEAPKFATSGPDVIITASSEKLGEAAALQALFPKSSFLLDDAEPKVSVYLTKADHDMGGKPSTAKTELRCVSG